MAAKKPAPVRRHEVAYTLRVTEEWDDLVSAAARHLGIARTEFVRMAGLERARAVLKEKRQEDDAAAKRKG